MRFTYELSYEDFKNAQRVYRKRRPTARLWFVVWTVVLPTCAAAIVLANLVSKITDPYGAVNMVARSLLPLGIIWLFMPVLFLFSYRNYWKRLIPESLPHRSIRTMIPAVLELTEDQLISQLPGRSEGRFFWSALPGFSEDEKIGLIFIAKKQFIFVPKRAVSKDGWSFIRSHVTTKE